jgi:hypothetical protein
VSAVEQFVKQYGRLPVAKEMKPAKRLPSRRTFESKVGLTFFEYGRQFYPELVELSETRHRQHVADRMREKSQWTKETLITAVQHFVEQHGRLPDIHEYTSDNNLPSYTTFCRIATIALTDYLEKHFYEYINQTLSPKEVDTDAIEQDESSLEMTMAL